MTSIVKRAVTAIAAALPALLGTSEAAAQSVYCESDTIKVCDSTIGQKWILNLKDIPAGYSQILITYRISLFPNEEQHAQEYINNIADNKYLIFVDTYTLASVDGGAQAGQADVTLSITDIQYSNSAQDRREVEVLGSGKTTWRIYGTPVPDDALPADDPHRLSFTSPLRNCGYEAEITTEDSWADISRWRWTVSDDETFKIDPIGNYATLSTPHYANGELQTDSKTARVTITKTVGGICTASVARDITLLGSPEVIISRNDGLDEPIRICSSTEDDENSYVNVDLALAGHAPFTVSLNTGNQKTFEYAGVNTIYNIHVANAMTIKVDDLVDAHGCKATDETTLGSITVLDRKPEPTFPSDTIDSQETRVKLTTIPTDELHSFKWGVAEDGKSLDTHVYGTTHQASAKSTMWANVTYYVIETDDGDDLQYAPCPSDTARVTVRYAMPLRYPNGFSPNGDGRNDKLVIEGLPPKNMVTVVDSRGKTVFEATDYRNNWNAEGVDDGYYVYYFKGEGTKTHKETLVIKRNK